MYITADATLLGVLLINCEQFSRSIDILLHFKRSSLETSNEFNNLCITSLGKVV